jgi:uncharacterized hydrophobic protein (TIGR00271 family)
LLAVSNPRRVTGLATLAARMARCWDGQVVVLHVVRPGRPPSGPSETPPESRGPWPAVGIALDVLEQAGVPAAWLVREAEDAGQAIRETASELRARLIILGWRGVREADGTYLDATLKAVLEDPLWDVMVVGGQTPNRLGRILVPLGMGPHSELALRVAADLACLSRSHEKDPDCQVTALRVISEETHGLSLGTLRHLQHGLGRYAADPRVRRKAVMGPDKVQAILDELHAGYDVVVMGTSREALIDRLLFGDIPQEIAARSSATVVVVRRRTDPLSWLVRRTWHSLVNLLPHLTAEERAAVHENILHGSRSRVDFFAMMGLAATLASLGLLLNSPAVIIGAMLVAPLMSAIVGIGLGLIEGDTALIRTAVSSTVRAMLLAIALSMLLGLLVPDASATPEIMSRASPSLLDLGVALASGAAGAYALCRRDVSEALAGVAIAAALVPPLATVGIGLALGRWDVAGGALLLFVTNLLAIAAAGGVVFLLLGFAPPAAEKQRRNTLQRGLLGTAALLVAITVVLGLLTADSIRTARLDRAIQSAVNSEIAAIPDTELVQATTTAGSDGTLHLSVTVRSTRQFSYAEVLELQKNVAAELQRPVALLLTVIPAVRLNPLVPPTPTPTSSPTATPTALPTSTRTPFQAPAGPIVAPPTATPTYTPTVTPPSATPTPMSTPIPTPAQIPAAPAILPPGPTPSQTPGEPSAGAAAMESTATSGPSATATLTATYTPIAQP